MSNNQQKRRRVGVHVAFKSNEPPKSFVDIKTGLMYKLIGEFKWILEQEPILALVMSFIEFDDELRLSLRLVSKTFCDKFINPYVQHVFVDLDLIRFYSLKYHLFIRRQTSDLAKALIPPAGIKFLTLRASPVANTLSWLHDIQGLEKLSLDFGKCPQSSVDTCIESIPIRTLQPKKLIISDVTYIDCSFLQGVFLDKIQILNPSGVDRGDFSSTNQIRTRKLDIKYAFAFNNPSMLRHADIEYLSAYCGDLSTILNSDFADSLRGIKSLKKLRLECDCCLTDTDPCSMTVPNYFSLWDTCVYCIKHQREVQ
jgi:hypothetical protein